MKLVSILELCVMSSTGVVILNSLTLCCSRIPESMIKIKNTLAALIERHQVSDLTLGREIRLLERMEKKEIIYLTAYDMVYFKKNFCYLHLELFLHMVY
ncbi:hypothetical protein CEXT_720051 [Caerostris extrusa]|uniref:Uncharacterized protein n=1 Tax=Caerostris extrusa TaxID=172846 RepID=A0AAV4W9K4_CAEEX|nr:hypothetical protein CEXT_720051 [Caerostris extrusa]